MDPHDDAADTTGGWIIDRDEFLKLDRGQKVSTIVLFFFHPTFSQGSRVGQFSPQVQKSYRHSVDKMVSLLFSQSTVQSVSCW